MWRRRVMLAAVLMLGVWLIRPAAAALTDLQLCALTQFADTVVIGAIIQDDPLLQIALTWRQSVPNLYTLLGSGAMVRKERTVHTYIGGFFVNNNSETFGNNPTCTVTSEIEQLPTVPVSYRGSATLQCFNGPSGPFLVTLQLDALSCREPGFPAAEDAQALAGLTVQQTLDVIHAQGLTAAGEAVNHEAR